MIQFCPPNDSIANPIWFNHGISQCDMDTLSASIIGGFIIIFGSVQLFVYKKYSTQIEQIHLAKSRLYNFQIFLLLFIPTLAIARFLIEGLKFSDSQFYGFMILSVVLTVIGYLFSICLLMKERYYLLPSLPTRGHGLVLLLFWSMAFVEANLEFVNLKNKNWWFMDTKSERNRIELGFFVTRYICSLLIFVLGLKAPGIILFQNDESEPIVPDESRSAFANGFRKIRTLAPFLWPRKDFFLQFRVIICFVLLLIGRVMNVYVPIYSKKIVDSLSARPANFRWDWILMYAGFKFLQGGGMGSMGLLNNARSFLWIRVQQYTTREIEVELFHHLHRLSLRWHLGRKTGEVLRVMDRGTDSINNLLNFILFSIGPTIIDILVAIVFFIMAFNWWFGFIVFVTMTLYIMLTILITEWRTKFQRRMNLADNAQRARSVDSLLNFETVKYYGAEKYEVDCYRDAILHYQQEEFKSNITLNILNTVQNIIVCAGLLSGSLLCAYLVVYEEGLTVGDYVLFASYIVQLYVPLNWFGTFYRQIQKNFVDMENMFDLMREEQEVIDAPGAGQLAVIRGGIEFSNVSFGYSPERCVLRNVNFRVPAGKTLAIVGQSGAGKSTIMRLLFRFYDVDSGAIIIDGQNIKTVTQASLRKAIGVVPQDTVLFNNTIKYNIQYGRVESPNDQDVITAARSADIHERILTFPEQYETQVGERGLRLSGGEKQRVAIARTILKAPIIVLLDEATSALDTHTERKIQKALAQVCSNRTSIIIAHRLSTVIHADEIIVLNEGQIMERGNHEELMQQNGLYSDMWTKQQQNLEAKSDQPDVEQLDNVPKFAIEPAAASHRHQH